MCHPFLQEDVVSIKAHKYKAPDTMGHIVKDRNAQRGLLYQLISGFVSQDMRIMCAPPSLNERTGCCLRHLRIAL